MGIDFAERFSDSQNQILTVIDHCDKLRMAVTSIAEGHNQTRERADELLRHCVEMSAQIQAMAETDLAIIRRLERLEACRGG